jgi:uncharacterized protein
MLNIDYLKYNNLIIYECISGSKAYGTNTEQSDTDIKGVFILPEELFYGFETIEQITDDKNDVVYYELKKFLFLLGKNNPNILEMLFSPNDCILYKDELFELIKPELFLSKLCKETFANYAMDQIKRATGLNKKIMNPIDIKKKSILDFCFVTSGSSALSLTKWLKINNYAESKCGLSALSYFEDFYSLFYDETGRYNFNGIIRKEEKSFDVSLSSIPKELVPACYLYFNRNGYKNYIKKYQEYWTWVKNRNEDRYKTTISHGKNYDSKNMMHTIRLLLMAEDIAQNKTFNVRRPDKDFLLNIKKGKYEYDELIEMAEEKINLINNLFDQSDLPDEPDLNMINNLLIQIRKGFYNRLYN